MTSAAAHPIVGRTVLLMGPMASGKSSVGFALARILGADFADTDVRIVREHGPIPEIFAAHGEEAFRDLEAQAVADVLAEEHPNGIVVALGGGAVLRRETRERISGHHVVYLEVAWEDVAPRLVGSEDRPLLHGQAEASWRELMAQRRPVYETVATLKVHAAGGTADEVARAVADQLIPLQKELTRERRH
ncbi:shikimate kinase [Sinomonas terrae]|uniref:Shikimate kinase n=1 Tax=Sinomonas terrae TaxID=2908838 RepID=A0ABS9U0R6_9MICC|nr:shikimate kinase [Sinomonas terrae]MCH6470271.1 shikimate kinase [Sinomonas terrae]